MIQWYNMEHFPEQQVLIESHNMLAKKLKTKLQIPLHYLLYNFITFTNNFDLRSSVDEEKVPFLILHFTRKITFTLP